VEVGGRRLHLNVTGPRDGSPTVVLEAGLGSFSANWYWVQSALTPTTRVVSYDRAGLGWSEPGPLPRDAGRIAAELHTALHARRVAPPYVLVGHSFGGLPVRMFADRYPGEVAGMVLADTSHPDQWVRWPTPQANRLLAGSQWITAFLAWFGLLRVFDLSRTVVAGLPPRPATELRTRIALPRTSVTEARQVTAWRTHSRAQVNGARPLGGLPLVVLGVTEQPFGGELLTALQAELPGLSDNGVLRIVDGAGHESLVSTAEYAAAVVAAIRDVLDAARTGRSLS
jgi:pimeloyl-ACP methyl ester carboxylesterase